MTTVYKVLGQSNPPATTQTTLYQVPSSVGGAVASTLAVCNLGLSTNIRVAVQPNGAALAPQQYIVYDATLNANDSLFFTIGIAVAYPDLVSVYAGTSTVAFSLFGSELTLT